METQGTDAQLSISDSSAILKAKTYTVIKRVMAIYLTLLEDVADEHDEAMGKLVDALPPEHKTSVILADHFGDTRFEAIRRNVLKAGNDGYRELEELINGLRLND